MAASATLKRFYVLKGLVDEAAGLEKTMLEKVGEKLWRQKEWQSHASRVWGESENEEASAEVGLQCDFYMDADGFVTAVHSECATDLSKARKSDVYAFKEGIAEGLVTLSHVKGTVNPVDPLTKEKHRTRGTQGLWWSAIRGEGLRLG